MDSAVRLRVGLILLAALPLGACVAQPPRLEERHLLANLELRDGTGRLYYRDLTIQEAEALGPAVADVHSMVAHCLGFSPPRAELVVYAQGRETLGAVRETRCDLERGRSGWQIVFAYPYRADQVSHLLGTTGHEMAEATVLLRVTAIDPYLRWVHDGIADFAEHEVLRRQDPAAALDSLGRARRLVEEHLGDGELWLDLARWRQLAPWIVRSHRLLGPNEDNLSLKDVEGSLKRLARIRAANKDPDRASGLAELEAILIRARQIRERGFAQGEAHGSDAREGDLLGYALSFAYWLEVERRASGTIRGFLEGLERRRARGDHVLTGAEAKDVLRAALGAPPPSVAHYPLERALSVIKTEEARLQVGRK
ncbi:MAG: hypothetical protein JKY65_18015 [Planctomycetes bacterium]|nr:hypothetical protein [Planctomycetota bacterium]